MKTKYKSSRSYIFSYAILTITLHLIVNSPLPNDDLNHTYPKCQKIGKVPERTFPIKSIFSKN